MGLNIKVQVTRMPDLRRLLSTDPQMRARLNEAMREVIFLARKHASENIKQYMKNDPRSAYKAVHNSVYRKVIGASLNIFTRRRALRKGNVVPPGSNRYGNNTGPIRGRTSRTIDFYGYNGIDRGMILRWNNDGTANRFVTHMDGKLIDKSERERIRAMRDGYHNKKKGEKFKYGSIGGRGGASMIDRRGNGMFYSAALPEVGTVEAEFQLLVDKILLTLDF